METGKKNFLSKNFFLFFSEKHVIFFKNLNLTEIGPKFFFEMKNNVLFHKPKKIKKKFWSEKIDLNEILTNFDQSLTESSEKF